jgi:hypothetical protein
VSTVGPHEPFDEHVDAILRASRPEPPAQFVAQLERRLFPEPKAPRVRRPVLAGLAAAGATAMAFVALSLAGAGPLAPDGGSDVNAGSNCTTKVVKRPGKVPRITIDRNGQAHIHYVRGRVSRSITVCR